ncbi:Uncharacterised protein [[Clostridium] sordellii]|uniref:hypothetical protein n=1 Tax=Paraclostridium sordellii TaxID=1505 RepID=UPI0005E6B772|nr:hypothetical protein [Paeniclostridium sordellii]CEQ10658.1 Uncharacterised protein [[Clostridium] sordellii] [Paeniclostridium sordellii]
MKNISSKELNLIALSKIIENDPYLDGVVFLTSSGYIVGEVFDPEKEYKTFTLASILTNVKTGLLANKNLELNLIGDGSIIFLKNVIVKYSNDATLTFNELAVHCDDVIAFSPINIQDYLNQIDN